ASGVSGFFALACSLPFDYVKSQIQKMQPSATGKYPYSNSLDCFLKTQKVEGALKFYTEFPIYCVKIAHYVKGTEAEKELGYVGLVRYGLEIGRPTFVPVEELEMGFEKIVKIAHARGVCKRRDALSKLKVEREQSVERMDAFLRVVTSIPGIDNHDANAVILFCHYVFFFEPE
ncbi:hypothetical protein IFM89_029577, partial [Coptis chinensis]